MDIRNNTTLGTINNTPVVQFNNLFPGNINSIVSVELFGETGSVELLEENYCRLPEYCLIEDKHLYLAGLL